MPNLLEGLTIHHRGYTNVQNKRMCVKGYVTKNHPYKVVRT